MGGYGSGGRNSKERIVAEGTLQIDIRELRKRGCRASAALAEARKIGDKYAKFRTWAIEGVAQ